MIPKVRYTDLGTIKYQEAWDLQSELMKELIRQKRLKDQPKKLSQINHLLLCEHLPVITVGKNGSLDHLVTSEMDLLNQNIDFHKINRGGDVTYHGPGQITGYPIFDLDEFFSDVHRYVRCLEEVIILVLGEFHLSAVRFPGYTGVWIKDTEGKVERKICAIGVHLSRWVTMHGFALNVNTDLDSFGHIVPCGIKDPKTSVTSMQKELGREVELNNVKYQIRLKFAEVFNFEFI